jgi:hypothetical protein
MGERELRAKYGGKLAKAINRAIRAEIEGGNEALDTLTKLAGPAMQSGWKAPNGDPTPEAVAYARHKKNVVDKLEAIIRRKWGVPEEAPARARKDARRPVRKGKRPPGRAGKKR